MRIVKPCVTSPGFTCNPERDVRIDLVRAKDALVRKGYRVIDAEVLLIATRDEEVTVYPSGKILIKTSEEPVARRVADEVYAIFEGEGIL